MLHQTACQSHAPFPRETWTASLPPATQEQQSPVPHRDTLLTPAAMNITNRIAERQLRSPSLWELSSSLFHNNSGFFSFSTYNDARQDRKWLQTLALSWFGLAVMFWVLDICRLNQSNWTLSERSAAFHGDKRGSWSSNILNSLWTLEYVFLSNVFRGSDRKDCEFVWGFFSAVGGWNSFEEIYYTLISFCTPEDILISESREDELWCGSSWRIIWVNPVHCADVTHISRGDEDYGTGLYGRQTHMNTFLYVFSVC